MTEMVLLHDRTVPALMVIRIVDEWRDGAVATGG
jgi:hypothetical protein